MNDADCGGKAEFDGALRHGKSVFGMMDAAAEDGIDVDVKISVLGKELELLVEDFEALFRDFVRHGVINADLEKFETGAIEAFNSVGRKQIAVGDHAGDHSAVTNAADNVIEFGMEERLAAADGDDRSAEGSQAVNAPEHLLEWHGLRVIVKLIAICARQVTAADRNDVSEEWVTCGNERLGDHPPAPNCAVRREQLAPDFCLRRHALNMRSADTPKVRLRIARQIFPSHYAIPDNVRGARTFDEEVSLNRMVSYSESRKAMGL